MSELDLMLHEQKLGQYIYEPWPVPEVLMEAGSNPYRCLQLLHGLQ